MSDFKETLQQTGRREFKIYHAFC